MRILIVVTAAALGLASVAFASSEIKGQGDPKPYAAPASGGVKLPPPPRPVGLCRKDRALREKCTKEWDQCVVTAFPHGENPCPARWAACCKG
jgi:hypothetical protein